LANWKYSIPSKFFSSNPPVESWIASIQLSIPFLLVVEIEFDEERDPTVFADSNNTLMALTSDIINVKIFCEIINLRIPVKILQNIDTISYHHNRLGNCDRIDEVKFLLYSTSEACWLEAKIREAAGSKRSDILFVAVASG